MHAVYKVRYTLVCVSMNTIHTYCMHAVYNYKYHYYSIVGLKFAKKSQIAQIIQQLGVLNWCIKNIISINLNCKYLFLANRKFYSRKI